MKKRLFPLVLALLGLSLSGCSFLDLLSKSEESISRYSNEELSIVEGPIDKVHLNYTYDDFTKHSIYDVDSMPSLGEPKMLVVPLWFNDSNKCISPEEKEQIPSQLQKAFFGSEEETGWESVSSYYEKESYGKCKIGGEVLDWQNVNLNAAEIDSNDTSNKNPQIKNILKTTINAWKANNPEKAKEFDTDNNGFLDAVILIYGYYDNMTIVEHNTQELLKEASKRNILLGSNNDNLWAFTYWLQKDAETPNVESPVPNTYMFASYDFMYDSYDRSMIVDAHTYIHETGHLFGLEDYYNYADDLGKNAPQYAGKFSMQDYNVGGHDPYSILGLGWTDPYIPYCSGEVTIEPFATSGDVILLPSTKDESVFDEYILIELYGPTGVNAKDCSRNYRSKNIKGPNSYGLRVWHVDSRLITPDRIEGLSYAWSHNGITTQIVDNHKYDLLTSNTTYYDEYASYCSPLKDCRDYRLLELIRKNDVSGFRKDEPLAADNMFGKGDSFNLKNYSGYFKNGKFNNGVNVNYRFYVSSLTSSKATIKIEVTL